jgi:hypothetical protein
MIDRPLASKTKIEPKANPKKSWRTMTFHGTSKSIRAPASESELVFGG